jgi:hypothetical protein
MSKSKFLIGGLYRSPPKNISQGVEVTSWDANFDRYMHLLKIMATREKCTIRGTNMSLKKQCGKSYETRTVS